MGRSKDLGGAARSRRRGGRNAEPELGWSIDPTCFGGVLVGILFGALLLSHHEEPRTDLELRLSTIMTACLEEQGHTVGQPCSAAEAVALLDQGVNPDTLTHVRAHRFGYYLMHLAAGSALPHSDELLAALIDAGGNVNRVATKGDQRTALYVAAVNGQIAKARMLLEAGASVDRGDKLQTSPLFISAQDGNVPMVELLLEYGADATKATTEGWYALNVAASECVELRNNRKVCENTGRTTKGEEQCKHLHPMPVGVAAFTKVVQLLLDAGADPLQQDVEGSPALHYAVWCDSPDMINSLIRHGADVNKKSLTGEPPIWVAAKRGDMELVETFLSEGADPIQPVHVNPANELGGAFKDSGETPQTRVWFAAEVAAKNGYIEVANRINQAVEEMSAETASEMGVDVTDIRDTVRPQACNRMMDKYANRAESIIKNKYVGGMTTCGEQLSEAEKLFPIPPSVLKPPPPSLPPPPPPPPAQPNPGADLRRAIGKEDGGMFDPSSAAALAASLEASNTIDMLLQGGKFVADLPLDRYPTHEADDPRTAYMRLLLWAAAAKAIANFYGLDPSDEDFRYQQSLLVSRSQQLLGAGDVHVLSAFQQLDVNTDYRLSLNEIAVLSSLLERIDGNNDGLLSQAELFSDEADGDWVRTQMLRIQDGGPTRQDTENGLGSPKHLPDSGTEPQPEPETEVTPGQNLKQKHDEIDNYVSAEMPFIESALLVGDSDTAEEEDAAFIDGLSELTMMMDKASSLGSLIGHSASTSEGISSESAYDTDSADSDDAHADSSNDDAGDTDGAQVDNSVRSRRQREEEHKGHNVDLDVTLELEEELRRMRGLR